MKKLLIATDAFYPRWDGITRFLSQVIPALKNSYEITVIAPQFPEFEKHTDKVKDYKIIRVPTYKFRFGDYNPPKFSKKIIREAVEQADIVWTQAIMPIGMLAIWYAHKMHKPVIDYIHSLEWELALNSLSHRNLFRSFSCMTAKKVARFFYNRCSLLMVPSSRVAENIDEIGIKTNTVIVHMGVDTNKFTPPEHKSAAKRSVHLNPNTLIIGYSGRLGREKNVETLYNAFMRIEKKFRRIRLVIVGKGVKELEELFLTHPKIRLIPYTNKMEKYLQAMDIYVMPSLTETSSLSTMEAMATGLPVITTKVGSFKQYIRDKHNGYFFPEKNDYLLSLKLEKLIKSAPIRESLGKKARITMLERYSWIDTVEKIKEILNRF
jgi:1,2-diacylglycerol 3-alpha-glucosyltransferase